MRDLSPEIITTYFSTKILSKRNDHTQPSTRCPLSTTQACYNYAHKRQQQRRYCNMSLGDSSDTCSHTSDNHPSSQCAELGGHLSQTSPVLTNMNSSSHGSLAKILINNLHASVCHVACQSIGMNDKERQVSHYFDNH